MTEQRIDGITDLMRFGLVKGWCESICLLSFNGLM